MKKAAAAISVIAGLVLGYGVYYCAPRGPLGLPSPPLRCIITLYLRALPAQGNEVLPGKPNRLKS